MSTAATGRFFRASRERLELLRERQREEGLETAEIPTIPRRKVRRESLASLFSPSAVRRPARYPASNESPAPTVLTTLTGGAAAKSAFPGVMKSAPSLPNERMTCGTFSR